MLNPFPELLNFSLLVPFLLRIFLGGYFLMYGYSLGKKISSGQKVFRGEWVGYFVALLSFLTGASLLLGFFTQIGALVLIFLIPFLAFSQKQNYLFLLSLFVMSLSLLISGSGLFAFDIPL